MKKYSIIFLFSISNIFAQNFSVGFDYSGLINGKNYESASLYTLEGEYEFIPNTLSAGFSASLSDTRINKFFIKNPPPENAYENSLKLCIQAKHFLFLLKNDSFTFKPYIGIELGYNLQGIRTYLNMPSSCTEDYFFGRNKSFYTNFNLGGIIFPEKPFSFVFGLKYQINNPTIKYEKPNCSDDGQNCIEAPTEYTKKVNLDMFLWNVGFRINF